VKIIRTVVCCIAYTPFVPSHMHTHVSSS